MTRSDLVEILTQKFDLSNSSPADMDTIVNFLLDALSSALVEGKRIEIRGFGSFSISRRPSRLGRNPRSGAQVVIPEKLVPHFRPGKALREAVDNKAH